MPTGSALIVIDGAHGEGGGALLRTALAMAALTQQPLRVTSVRGGTRYPGLDGEDLTILRALAQSCAAETTGAEIGSTTVGFLPARRPQALSGFVATAPDEGERGPNALVVLNTLLPALCRSGAFASVSAEGETYGHNSLGYDAFANITLSALRRLGLYAYPDLVSAGFGRQRRGLVNLEVEPSALQGIDWNERGRFEGMRALVTTAGVPATIGERGAAHLRQLARGAGCSIDVEQSQVQASSPGVYVTVWAAYENGIGGGGAMGARGLRVETLAQNAFEQTFEWMRSDATLDPFLADQLLLPCVLAETPSSFKVSRLTTRFLTSVWVVKQFTPIHITVRGAEGGPGAVTIRR